MAGIKIVDLPALGRDLISTDLLEVSLNGSGSRKITGQEIMNASKLAVGSTPIVSGTVGRLLFQNTGDVLGQSANLFWDNTNGRLGIGTTSPSTGTLLDVIGTIKANVLRSDVLNNTSNTITLIYFTGTGNRLYDNSGTQVLNLRGGNLQIGTTTDNGYKLNVNGPGNYEGNLRVGVGFQLLFNNNNVGLYREANTLKLGGFGGIELTASATQITAQSIRMKIFDTGNVAINTTTDDGFRLDVNGTARVVGPTFAVGDWTQRSTSVYVRALTGGSENRGFYIGVGASNDGNAGSFTYQQTTGMLNIRSPYNSGTIALSFEGNTNSTQFHNTSGTAVSKFFSNTGNWGINTTTDAGYKLDVNGDTRLKGSGSTSLTYALTVQNSAGTNLLAVRNNNTTYISDTVTVNAQIPGGTGMVVSHIAWNGSTGLSVNSAIGILAWSSLGANSSNPDGASIVAKGKIGGDPLRKSVGLRSNRAIISAGFAMDIVDSAMLQVDSTTQGFLPPRMTNAERAAIASPAVGLIVYCTDSTEGLYVYKSTGWTFMV